ncbi:bifunctional adenosylcobinamide kinase/adenosylcobinamide-phosphate guanylyltransferase [Lacrimispora sp. JR3]|uniref:bifunctional adenosylcobinamide kinase/adenosylcobinamide-phosphate guanylyltransferase n=1 Tax=Lacrimispora sinapis TaxID=3111456 RepID=UPI00374862D4
MILIIGGAWQGKLAFAKELAEKAGIQTAQVAQGRTDRFDAALKRPIIHDFHEYIRRILKEGKSVEEFIASIEKENKDAIIISNELGCGIVPMEPKDREWREVSGRSAVLLAKKAEEVYRLVCGIASRIK